MERFPDCRSVITFLRNRERSWRDVHHGVTNYEALLYLIRNRRDPDPVCFVTFNHDTMLEEAIPTLGVEKPTAIQDYIKSPHYKLIKVHGSVNWGRMIRGAPLQEEFYRKSADGLALRLYG